MIGAKNWSGIAVLACLAVACSAEEDSGRSGNGTGTTGGGAASGGTGSAGSGESFGDNPQGGATAIAGSAALFPGEQTCAQGMQDASPVIPTVWLVLDGSGSMRESFGGPSRWDALRSALMDQGGVVQTLEQVVRFGMVIYSGNDVNAGGQCNPLAQIDAACGCTIGIEPACCTMACGFTPPPPPDPTMCVELVTVNPDLNNYANLSAQYPAQQLGGWTPTDKALDHVVKNLPVVSQGMLDANVGPIYVILATDGAPNDRCDPNATGGFGGGSSGFDPVVAQRVLDVTTAGANAGMKMFVISLAGGDAPLQMHLVQVAQLGGTGQPPFVPATKDDLVATLQQIIGGATCSVALDGTVAAGQECAGKVLVNGVEVPCGSSDGWVLSDPRTVLLQGQACNTFLTQQSQVRATFPCNVFTPD